MSTGKGAKPDLRKRSLIAVILSILVPGLGHIYLRLFPRALLWFAGIIIVSLVVSQGDPALWVSASFGAVLGVAAAIDAWILLHFE